MDRSTSNAKTTTTRQHDDTRIAPVLRRSQNIIAQLSKRRSTSISHLQDAVIADPSVAINLFANANDGLAQIQHPQVTDIRRAISFLGVQNFFSLISNAALFEDSYTDAAYTSNVRLLARAHHAAHQAHAIAHLFRGVNSDQVFAATLTQDVSEYVTATSDLNAAALKRFDSLLPSPVHDPDISPIFRTCVDLGKRIARATQSSWQESVLLPIVANSARYAVETPMLLRDEF